MLRNKTVIGLSALVLVGANVALAQVSSEEEQARAEQQAARATMEEARRKLEEAARTIATQVRIHPNGEDFDFDLDFDIDSAGFAGFGGQGQIGASIVNVDGGALVTRLTEDGGAEAAGLKVGDVIQSINGTDLTAGDDQPSGQLVGVLGDVEVGDTVALVVERAGEELEFDVEKTDGAVYFAGFNGPGFNQLRVLAAPDAPDAPRFAYNRLLEGQGDRGLQIYRPFGFAGSPWGDMELAAVTEGLGRYFDTSEGLLVVRGPEDDAIDIQDGDVILEISGRTPNSPEHAIRILSSFESGETIEFSIMRDGRRDTIEYAIPERQNVLLHRPDVLLPVPTAN